MLVLHVWTRTFFFLDETSLLVPLKSLFIQTVWHTNDNSVWGYKYLNISAFKTPTTVWLNFIYWICKDYLNAVYIRWHQNCADVNGFRVLIHCGRFFCCLDPMLFGKHSLWLMIATIDRNIEVYQHSFNSELLLANRLCVCASVNIFSSYLMQKTRNKIT